MANTDNNDNNDDKTITCDRDFVPHLIACLEHAYRKLDDHAASGDITVKGTDIEVKWMNGIIQIIG